MANTPDPQNQVAPQLPPEWKWAALFQTPDGFQPVWRAWLAAAQQAEDLTLLRYWSQRAERAA